MIDLNKTLKELSLQRPFFYSEKDFQFALGWKIKEIYYNIQIRLERKLRIDENKKVSIDICVIDNETLIPIEVKYKTESLTVIHEGEKFNLASQNAQDQGRYDFLKDIMRIERTIEFNNLRTGYVILITNDPSYWEKSTSSSIDEEFRIYEDRKLEGTLRWKERAADGTTKGRKKPIELSGSYKVKWNDYYKTEKKNQWFRYLLLKIQP